MGTRLETPKGKTLYDYWGSSIAQYLNERQEGQKSPVIVNLASEEYFKSVDLKALKARVVQCVFQDWKNGAWKIISFHASGARGLMARYAIAGRQARRAAGLRPGGLRLRRVGSRRTTSWCSGASSEPWLAVVKMAAFRGGIFDPGRTRRPLKPGPPRPAPGACAGSSSASSSWRISVAGLDHLLERVRQRRLLAVGVELGRQDRRGPLHPAFVQQPGHAVQRLAHRRGRLRQRRQDRMVAVICEASTWFWISRLFSSAR